MITSCATKYYLFANDITNNHQISLYFQLLYYKQGGADISSDQINTLLEATGNTEVQAFYPIIFANFLSADKITDMIVAPVTGGGGGGGGAGGGGGGDGGEEEKEEEKEEVEGKFYFGILFCILFLKHMLILLFTTHLLILQKHPLPLICSEVMMVETTKYFIGSVLLHS